MAQVLFVALLCLSSLDFSFGQWVSPFTEYQERAICTDRGIYKIYYDKGFYKCKNGKVSLQTCIDGNKVDPSAWFCSSSQLGPETEETFQQAASKVCRWHRARPRKQYALYRDFKLLYCVDDPRSGAIYTEGECLYKNALRDRHDISMDFGFIYYGQTIPLYGRDVCIKHGTGMGFISSSEIQALTAYCPRGEHEDPCLWPDQTIYYSFDPKACDLFKELVDYTIRKFSESTCLKFIDVDKYRGDKRSSLNYVKIVETDSVADHAWQIEQRCHSAVGMRGGEQIMEANFYCVFQKFHQLIGLPEDRPVFSLAEYYNSESWNLDIVDIMRIEATYRCPRWAK